MIGIHHPMAATRTVLRQKPVCGRRLERDWCKRIATSVVVVDKGSPDPLRNLEPRCQRHADPDAVRMCIGCRGENNSADEYHCGSCQDDPLPELEGW